MGGRRGGGGGKEEEESESSERGEEKETPPPATTAAAISSSLALPRVKPFLHTYEKEIVLYAHHRRLDYFCTECSHAKFAARGGPREAVKAMESAAPASVAGLVRTAVALSEAAARFAKDCSSSNAASAASARGREDNNDGGKKAAAPPPPSSAAAFSSSPGECERCGGLSSGAVCKACELLGQLALGVDEKGRALMGDGAGTKARAKAGTKAGATPGRKKVTVAFEV